MAQALSPLKEGKNAQKLEKFLAKQKCQVTNAPTSFVPSLGMTALLTHSNWIMQVWVYLELVGRLPCPTSQLKVFGQSSSPRESTQVTRMGSFLGIPIA